MRTVREMFLKSSQIFVSRDPVLIKTVVGSCVAVALYDHKSRIGGMNHFLLPEGKALEATSLGKFGNLAIPELLRRLETLGAERTNVIAKVVGGAHVLTISSHSHIPQANIKSARQALSKLSIPVVGQDTGGKSGRKVEFDLETGHLVVNQEKRL